MNKLSVWAANLKLSVNTSKTKYMLFNADKEFTINIHYNNSLVEKVQEFKYLGLTLDYKLGWDSYCQTEKEIITIRWSS